MTRRLDAVSRTRLTTVALSLSALSVVLWSGSPAQAQEALVHFPSDAGPEAQRELDLGFQALHDFWYAEAIDRFQAAQALEPDLVFAYWGEALSHQDPFQLNGADLEAMRTALERLAPTPAERRARASTDRERAYLDAIERLAGEGSVGERNRAYSRAMREVALTYPEDLEARAFYALSLFGTVETNLRLYPELREEVAAAAATVLERAPRHPGALHYTIHALDTPDEAPRVLDVARTYLEVGTAPHAIHMSSHIFIQHGLWPDVIAANERAWEVSVRWAERTRRDATAHAWHPADFLHYGLLQSGRIREARAWRERAADLLEAGVDSGTLRYFRGLWAARETVERGLWGEGPDYRSGYGTRPELLADGLDAVHSGDAERLVELLERLDEQVSGARDDGRETASSRRWAAAAAQLRAADRHRRGDGERAITLLHEAIELLEQVPPPNETPDPLPPPHEELGRILLDLGRPREAMRAYHQALENRAGRLAAKVGLARSAAAADLPHAAARHYRELLEQLDGADAGLPELEEARAWLKTHREGLTAETTTDDGR